MSKTALTYRDYAALPGDGRRYQVLDGELFVTAAPGTRHQIILMRLSAQLHAHIEGARTLGGRDRFSGAGRWKRELYARYGVPFYWSVDGDANAIEMYGLAGGAYVDGHLALAPQAPGADSFARFSRHARVCGCSGPSAASKIASARR